MVIRPFTKADTISTAQLITKTFRQFNSHDFFDPKAVKKYADTFDPELNRSDQLYQLFQQSPIFLVAEQNHQVIGMIRGKEHKISNLFVDADYHRQHIGTKLVTEFEERVRQSNTSKINVKSTLYAVPFYENLGYVKTSPMINYMGLKVFPMSKQL
jgi:ribosomal protein S18 acetylase RimI-like enzyme